VNSGLFQILVAVAAVIALWAKQRREAARSRGEAPGAPASGRPDPMEEERTRRVQEEIRRKIAQRNAWQAAREENPPAMTEEPPPMEEAPGPEEVAVLREAPPPPEPAPSLPARAAALPASAAPSGDWLTELRGTRGARRAMVLREILGPPVGLR
jgi:hypothetical protein